jgi:glycogen debranching enzyme
VEVQAYAYAALRSLADAFERLGDGDGPARMRAAAAELRERVNADFWLEDEGCYALALDGENQRAASITSNAGHALWGGITDRARAERTASRLMQRDMFSGWGIRTLSSESPRYNPQGYHLGTVWPHDNSIIAMGMKRYGLETELNTIVSSLYRAAQMFQYYRLPELFGGSEASGHQTPVPYPVACKPQAWAAGAFPLMTQAMLGLHADAPARKLWVVNPLLPDFVGRVDVRGLRVGDAEADLLYQRRGSGTWATVRDVRGGLEVEIVKEWPE